LSRGKLTLAVPFDEFVPIQLATNGFTLLPLQVAELGTIVRLPLYHGAPFDRLLVAQALTYTLPLISIDAKLDQYGINRLW
jgi:PIN domain nuclease of toxin-antitoxin system